MRMICPPSTVLCLGSPAAVQSDVTSFRLIHQECEIYLSIHRSVYLPAYLSSYLSVHLTHLHSHRQYINNMYLFETACTQIIERNGWMLPGLPNFPSSHASTKFDSEVFFCDTTVSERDLGIHLPHGLGILTQIPSPRSTISKSCKAPGTCKLSSKVAHAMSCFENEREPRCISNYSNHALIKKMPPGSESAIQTRGNMIYTTKDAIWRLFTNSFKQVSGCCNTSNHTLEKLSRGSSPKKPHVAVHCCRASGPPACCVVFRVAI